jgi:hypothetical protein
MPTSAAGFPDVEYAVCQALMTAFPDLTADTVTPADLADHLPFAQVRCYGGADDGITDLSRLTINYFDASRALAQPGVEAVRQFITRPGGFTYDTAVIDTGGTDVKPQQIPWNDANTPVRFVYSCSVACRRTVSS